MNNRPSSITRYIGITAAASVITLSACSSVESVLDNKVDYRSGSDNLNRNPLEIPPDLTHPNNLQPNQYHTGASSYTEQTMTKNILSTYTNKILPHGNDQAKLVQEGNERWLVVKAPPEKIWPQLREFWLNQGFALEIDSPNIGVLETDWLENRAKLPQNFVRKTIGRVIDNVMSTGEMDKYRTRIERGPDNSTEIFISHRGMVEVFKKDGKSNGIATNAIQADTIWTPRPTDPQLEAIMLNLMLQQLGLQEEVAKATIASPVVIVSRTTLIDSTNGKALLVDDSFDRAWRRVGLALDRIGYVVVDRNRDAGVYYVRRAPDDVAQQTKPGFLASLAFWKTKRTSHQVEANTDATQAEFEVHLIKSGDKTQVQIVPKNDANSQIEPFSALNRLLAELK